MLHVSRFTTGLPPRLPRVHARDSLLLTTSACRTNPLPSNSHLHGLNPPFPLGRKASSRSRHIMLLGQPARVDQVQSRGKPWSSMEPRLSHKPTTCTRSTDIHAVQVGPNPPRPMDRAHGRCLPRLAAEKKKQQQLRVASCSPPSPPRFLLRAPPSPRLHRPHRINLSPPHHRGPPLPTPSPQTRRSLLQWRPPRCTASAPSPPPPTPDPPPQLQVRPVPPATPPQLPLCGGRLTTGPRSRFSPSLQRRRGGACAWPPRRRKEGRARRGEGSLRATPLQLRSSLLILLSC